MDHSFDTPIPEELVKHVGQILGKDGTRWLQSLPGLIAELEQLWSVRIGVPFAAGEFNFVAPAIRRGTEDVVVKIAPPYRDDEALSEMAWLRRRNGAGCIQLIEQERDSRAYMMERAVPGRSLAEGSMGKESAIVPSAILVLRAIQMPMPCEAVDIIDLDDWFSNLERALRSGFAPDYVEKAMLFYRELSDRAPKQHLHGDFHPGNIVSATREPFLAIDPKGIAGPLGYDIAVFLNNLYWGQKDKVDAASVKVNLALALDEFSAAFEISESDLRKWAFATQVLGAWWTFDEMPALYSGGVVKADVWDV